VGLPELNQDRMLEIRNAWFEQLGGPPIGNKREWQIDGQAQSLDLSPASLML